MKIELIRHGKTAWQDEKRYQGSTDLPLSDAGRAELVKAGYCPQAVYASPLKRAVETAGIIFHGAFIIEDPGLREMDFGVFEGRNHIDMENDPEYRKWVDGMCLGRCPGGESGEEFFERAGNAFRDLVKKAASEGYDDIAVVAHGGTQMAALGRFAVTEKEYYKWQTAPGSGYILEADPDMPGRFIEVKGTVCHTAEGK